MTSLILAMEDTLLRINHTTDTNAWEVTDQPTEHAFECVGAPVKWTGTATVYCGTFHDGLYQSTETEPWHRIGQSTLPSAITAIAVSPTDPDVVWVGTEPSAVYVTEDAGDTWTERPGLTELPSADTWYFPPRPDTHHVRWIELDPADPERIYLGIEAGAFVYSTDAGTTWHDRPPGSRRDNHQIATHHDAPGRVYSAAGDGYAESDNGGESWRHPQDGLDHRYVWSLGIDPGDPDRVLISAASGARKAHYAVSPESYIYRKHTDHWERIETDLPTGRGVLRAVFASGQSAGTCFAANNHGIYRTTDFGDTWNQLPIEWPSRFSNQTVRGLAVYS